MGYLKLAEEPQIVVSYPDCGTCGVEVESIADGWLCPSCGSEWDYADDGAYGELSEKTSGPECPNKYAWRVSHLRGAERDVAVTRILEALSEDTKVAD